MLITIKLICQVNDDLKEHLHSYEKAMKHEIYKVAGVFQKENRIFAFPYKQISNDVSWNSKQNVIDQASIFYGKKQKKHKANLDFSSVWSNRSYWIHFDGRLELELGRNQGAKHIFLPFYVHERQIKQLQKGEYRDMTIKERGKEWFAFIWLDMPKAEPPGNLTMGIDIGIKNPAVVYTSDHQVKFFGNGRQLRFLKTSFRKKISMMQRNHQYKKLRAFSHRLSRILTNADHKISKQIIDYAIAHQIGIIKLEKLTGIHNRFDVQKSKDMYLWSYQRLQYFIQYKAELAGIEVRYIQPYNTSKLCPKCKTLNQPIDRVYKCSICGYACHRDIVGAHNIMLAL